MRKRFAKQDSEKRGPRESVKGMRDLIGPQYLKFQGFAEKAAEIALYYGFTPIETPILEHEEIYIHGTGAGTDIVEKELYRLRTKGGDHLALRPEGTPGLMRAYLEHGMQTLPQPVMLYQYGPRFRHDRPQKGRFREFRQFDIDILGSEKAINDALIIHVAALILGEAGVPNIRIEINSIGDKECRGNFRRELTGYYRKHLGSLCKDCQRRLRDNPLRLLDCKICATFKTEAPTSISFLCELCKRHFKEVLEYLEVLKTPYTLNNSLVRGIDYYTRTVFEFFSGPEGKTANAEPKETPEENEKSEPIALGGGGRYDYLAKELGSTKPVFGVGAALGVDRIIEIAKAELTPRIVKKPKIFFIQLGFEAKLKSLSVIEVLRQAKIPLIQSLAKDNLGSQLATAEKLKIPYTLILGQKEVMENSVIVRDMENRSQKSISLEKLTEYVKKLK